MDRPADEFRCVGDSRRVHKTSTEANEDRGTQESLVEARVEHLIAWRWLLPLWEKGMERCGGGRRGGNTYTGNASPILKLRHRSAPPPPPPLPIPCLAGHDDAQSCDGSVVARQYPLPSGQEGGSPPPTIEVGRSSPNGEGECFVTSRRRLVLIGTEKTVRVEGEEGECVQER